jgi:hypothetical protein
LYQYVPSKLWCFGLAGGFFVRDGFGVSVGASASEVLMAFVFGSFGPTNTLERATRSASARCSVVNEDAWTVDGDAVDVINSRMTASLMVLFMCNLSLLSGLVDGRLTSRSSSMNIASASARAMDSCR